MKQENDRFEIKTKIDGYKIQVSTEFMPATGNRSYREYLYQQIIDTEEKAARNALIQLGWIPPSEFDLLKILKKHHAYQVELENSGYGAYSTSPLFAETVFAIGYAEK